MRVDATCPKVCFPVEFLHCSQFVSQYLSVCHHTSQRTLPRCEVTSLHYFGRTHLNMHPADLDFSMKHVVSKNGNWSQPCTIPTTTENSATQHHWNCGTTQQGALDNTESTRLERLSVDQLQHLLMNIWTKVSSDSRPTIRQYNDVTMPCTSMRVDATGPKVLSLVEFLHCSHCVSTSTCVTALLNVLCRAAKPHLPILF